MKKILYTLALLISFSSFGQNKLMKTLIKYSSNYPSADTYNDIKPKKLSFYLALNRSEYSSVWCQGYSDCHKLDLQKLEKLLEKHKIKNGEDISTEFVELNFQLKKMYDRFSLDDFDKYSFYDRATARKCLGNDCFPYLEYLYNLQDLYTNFSVFFENYSQQELNDIGVWNVINKNFLSDLKEKIVKIELEFEWIISKRNKRIDIWTNIFSYLKYIKSNYDIIKYDKKISKFEKSDIGKPPFFEITNSDQLITLLAILETHPELTPNLGNDFKWGDQYSILDDDNEFKKNVTKYIYLRNLWINTFKDSKNDILIELQNSKLKNNKNFDYLMISSYISNNGGYDGFTFTQLYQHIDDFEKLENMNKLKNYIFRKKFKNKGYCSSEKHRERLLKEFQPKNGIKITKGVLKIVLQSDRSCSFSWEVYDTTLLGKVRVSWFRTSVKNPDDKEILVTLEGSDTITD